MIDTIHSPDAHIKDTGTIKSRSAFAKRDLAAGEIVEQCSDIALLRSFEQLSPRLKTVVFNWENSAKTNSSHTLALGFGSLYNHDNPANLSDEAAPNNEAINFIAVCAINKDEELIINYNAGGGRHQVENDTWFERHNIAPYIIK